jgi:hypothetical protein
MQSRESLETVVSRLRSSGIDFVIGGSGMMNLLGAQDRFDDWDVMTDASPDKVRAALQGLTYTEPGPKAPFDSDAFFEVTVGEEKVDVICGFSLVVDGERVRFPAVVASVRQGLPLPDPRVWTRIYEALGQDEKALRLREASVRN